MGRNSGSGIRWTHMNDGGTSTYTYYCQHHKEFDRTNNFNQLKFHIRDDHGDNEQ